MTDLPNGPLPDVSVLKPRVQAILEEVGVASLNMNDLRKRLQGEYKINMKPHVEALNTIVCDIMKEPAMKVALAKAAKAAQAPAGQVTKREKGAAKEKAQKKEKAAKKEKAPKAGKKEKIVKDENEPKRALSAYFIFGNEKRPAIMEAIRAKGEKINVADIGKQITALWSAETNKQKYEALAAKDKERYAAEKAKFEAEGGVVAKRSSKKDKEAKKAKKAKVEGAPKRALSAYFIFGNEKRPAMEAIRAKGEKINVADIGKQITALWSAETNKQKYEALAAKDKERYAAEKAKFDAEGGAVVKATKKTSASKKRAASSSASSSSSSSSDSSDSSSSDSSSSSSSDSD